MWVYSCSAGMLHTLTNQLAGYVNNSATTRTSTVENMRQGTPSQSGSWLAALHLRATLTLPAHLRDGGVHRRCALLISHACLSEQALRNMRLIITAHQKIPAWKER